MQIDKIEICNLASIAGEQVIDFTQEPLRSAGLFAITGKTGAGKSTILDAICLALYNEAPRLGNRENTPKADADMPSIYNPCNMLRRGTTQGYSKVTFSLPDTTQYQATWTVALTRTGTFKPIQRELVQLKPRHNTLGTSNKEVQQMLLDILRLDYSQFTRTVILAQNSFTSFLAAKRGEKSQLLEKITGTEIYATISSKIYQLTKESERKMSEARQHLEGLGKNTLNDEDLAQTRNALNMCQSLQTRYDNEQNRIVRQLEWHEQYLQATADLEEKKAANHEAQKAYNATYDQQCELNRYDRLQQFSPTFLSIQMVQREMDQYKEKLSQSQALAEMTRNDLDKYQSEHNDALGRQLSAQQRWRSKEPDITAGRRIEGQLSTTRESLNTTIVELTRQDEELTQRRDNYNSKEAELRDCDRRLEGAKLTRQTMIQHQSMIGQIELVRTRLEKMDGLRHTIADCQQELDKANVSMAQLREMGRRLEDEAHQQQETMSRLKAELLIHEQANRSLNSGVLQMKLNELSRKSLRSGDAIVLWKRIDKSYTEISERQDDLRRRRVQNGQREIEIKNMLFRLSTLEDTYEQVHRNYTLSQSKDITNLRQELKEGEPCPLCGSTHHPFHSDSAQHFEQLIENLTSQHQQAQEDLANTRRELDQLQKAYNDEQGRLDAEEKFLQRIVGDQQDNVQAWQAFADLDTTFGQCDENVNRHNRFIILKQINESSTREHDEVKRTLNDFNQHQDEMNRINNEMQSMQQNINDNTRNKAELTASGRALENKITSLQQAIDRNKNQLAHDMAGVDPLITISSWKERWENSYEALDRELQSIKTQWEECNSQVGREEQEQFKLRQELQTLSKSLDDLLGNRQSLMDKADLLRAQAARLQDELHNMFGQNTVDEEAQRLQKDVEDARQEVQTTQTAYNKTKQRLDQLMGETQSLRDQLNTYEKEHQALRTQLDIDIARFNTGEHSTLQYFELDKYFSNPQDWAQTRATIDQLRTTLDATTFRLNASQQTVTQLEQSPYRPSADEPDSKAALEARLGSLQAEMRQNLDQLKEHEFRIKAHDNSVEQTRQYKPTLARAEEDYEHWNRLCQVLGSADGKAFREIAQRHTFDFLVKFANQQLSDLTPRYQLQARPDSLQLEVIDHHMFDQVRAANSLSGGETFIVSLSLALGLSALSSNNLQIGSLFIDEGFGNLDADNLSMVIDALSNLQNTQRRKVGVISHTEQIQNRISPQIHVIPETGGKSKIAIQN